MCIPFLSALRLPAELFTARHSSETPKAFSWRLNKWIHVWIQPPKDYSKWCPREKKRQRWQKWMFWYENICVLARVGFGLVWVNAHIIFVEVHTSSRALGVNKISHDDGRQGQVWDCPSAGDAISCDICEHIVSADFIFASQAFIPRSSSTRGLVESFIASAPLFPSSIKKPLIKYIRKVHSGREIDLPR